MRPIPPYPTIPGDNPARIMARSGSLLGFSRSRFVWRFGFAPGSEESRAHGIESPDPFAFILTDASGCTLARFDGFALNMPKRFRAVIDARAGALR